MLGVQDHKTIRQALHQFDLTYSTGIVVGSHGLLLLRYTSVAFYTHGMSKHFLWRRDGLNYANYYKFLVVLIIIFANDHFLCNPSCFSFKFFYSFCCLLKYIQL
jgi:hypothetical protein